MTNLVIQKSRKLLTATLASFCVLVMKFIGAIAPRLHIRAMITNHQFFGHLVLEPEKFLSIQDAKMDLYEIDFIGAKDWKNIAALPPSAKSSHIITIWSLGGRGSTPNRQLVKMWKRYLTYVPGFVLGMFVRACETGMLSNVSTYRFSSLLSADKALDQSPSHLSFLQSELKQVQIEAFNLGIDLNKPWVCLIVRNESASFTNSEYRSRSISDFDEAVHLLAEAGLQVVRMGASKSPPLLVRHPLVFDYANSGQRTEILDLFLLAKCSFAISTLSGPDAVCLAFRRPVLYIDLANYALCFSGTSLTTWTPAKIVSSTGRYLSLEEVFECGAGWFWQDSQFSDSGMQIERSSSSEIAEYVNEYIAHWRPSTGTVEFEDFQQSLYKSTMESSMGELGSQWHGQIRSQISPSFLLKHAEWFLRR